MIPPNYQKMLKMYKYMIYDCLVISWFWQAERDVRILKELDLKLIYASM